MDKEQIRKELLEEGYPKSTTDWALDKFLKTEKEMLDLLSAVKEWSKRGLPMEYGACFDMAAEIRRATLKKNG